MVATAAVSWLQTVLWAVGSWARRCVAPSDRVHAPCFT